MGPTLIPKGPDLWRELNAIRGSWNGAWCVGGDWNIVCFPSKKLGGGHLSAATSLFSDWINSHSLIDLQLGGASFTWSNHQRPPLTSRLDRFLVSVDWLDLYPELYQLALPKLASNHCPIVLDSRPETWGATPFRLELAWLENEVFLSLVKVWWADLSVAGWAGYELGIKLKLLKGKSKSWVANNIEEVGRAKARILDEIQSIDKAVELGALSEDHSRRRLCLKDDYFKKVRGEDQVEAEIPLPMVKGWRQKFKIFPRYGFSDREPIESMP